MNGYSVIASNDKSANNFYTFLFTSIPYKPQEDVESDGNKLESGELVCNEIYTSSGRHKPSFYVNKCKIQKT